MCIRDSSDIEKAEKKKTEIEGQLKELYDKKTELVNLEIINTVRSKMCIRDSFGGEAKRLLQDLQTRNERLFLVTILRCV